jgi:ligand-binding sensor domain-containing protein
MKRNQLAWRTGIATLLLLLGALSLVEFAIHTALHKGWTTSTDYPGASFFTVDERGWLWTVTQESIILYPDEGEPVQMPLPGERANDSVLSLTVDREGRIWLGTVNRMLALRRIDTQWIIYVPEHLEAPIIGSDLVIDAQGQAWTNSPQEHGTELARIELHPESRTYTLANAGLGLIDTLAVDAQGQLWVLSANGELKTLDPAGSWRTLGTASKQDPDVTWAFSPFGNARLAIDRQGQAWIGVGNGVVHVLGLDGTWQTYSPDKSHPTIYTKGITIDSQGYMWGVVGGQGLYRFHPRMGWIAYHPSNSGLTATYSVTTLVTDGLLLSGSSWFCDLFLRKLDWAQPLPLNYLDAQNLSVCACYCYQISETRLQLILAYINT